MRLEEKRRTNPSKVNFVLNYPAVVALSFLTTKGVADMRHVFNVRTFKVGGIRFLRLGQFQLSFCRTRKPFNPESL
jgi:hypothetical protein